MASFKLEGIDNLMSELDQMDIGKIAPMMLEEAVPILEKAVKKKAEAHKETGNMYKSIKRTKAKRTGDGYSIAVRPTGKDAKGVRNMEKMAYLEYGTSRQLSAPILTPAVAECEKTVTKKMQEIFEREARV